MRRSARIMGSVAVAAAVAMLALTGCGRFGDGENRGGPSGDQAEVSDLAWDAQALQAIGYTTEELGEALTDAAAVGVTGTPAATPKPGVSGEKRAKHKRLRFAFGKRLLHGEAAVQTDDGPKTVVVQRGQVTAVTSTTITVVSTDGFSLVWTIGAKFIVVKDRQKVDQSAVTVGAKVGVAGAKEGGTATARLLVIAP